MKRTLTVLKSLSALFVLFVLTNAAAMWLATASCPIRRCSDCSARREKTSSPARTGRSRFPYRRAKVSGYGVTPLWAKWSTTSGATRYRPRSSMGTSSSNSTGSEPGPFAGERPDIRSRSSRATVSMANRPSTGPIMGSFGTVFSTHIWCGSFLTPCCGSTRTRFPISGCAFPIMS